MKWNDLVLYDLLLYGMRWDETRCHDMIWNDLAWYDMWFFLLFFHVTVVSEIHYWICIESKTRRFSNAAGSKPSSGILYYYIYIYVCIWNRGKYTWTSLYHILRGWESRMIIHNSHLVFVFTITIPTERSLHPKLFVQRHGRGALSSVAVVYYHRHERRGWWPLDHGRWGADTWCWMSCSDIFTHLFHPTLTGFKRWFFRKLRNLWNWVEMNQVFVCPPNS